jgi:hypothetical protein
VLGSQRFGQRDHGRLGGAVGPHLRLAFARGTRRNIDDAPAAIFQHDRDHGTRGMKDGTHVQVHHEVPLLVGSLVDLRSHGEAAGDVGNDVDGSVLGDHCFSHRIHRGLLEQVGLDDHRLDTIRQLFLHRFETLLVDVDEHNPGSPSAEEGCRGAAEVSCCTGDDDDFVAEFLHDVFPRFNVKSVIRGAGNSNRGLVMKSVSGGRGCFTLQALIN